MKLLPPGNGYATLKPQSIGPVKEIALATANPKPKVDTSHAATRPAAKNAEVASNPDELGVPLEVRRSSPLHISRGGDIALARMRSAPSAPARRLVARPRPTIADAIAPNLQPERPAQPDDMQITTADMKTPMPMPMAAGRSDMDPKSPMNAGKDGEAVVATPSEKSRFALAVQTETSTPGALVSLAELRRQLRKQNESVHVIHPELRLRGRRDMLDVVKSSF